MELHTNSSNNTIFADCRRQHRLLPLELHPEARHEVRLDEAGGRQRSGDRVEGRATRSTRRRTCCNPASGWLYNTNNWPWSAAGPDSPKKKDYPRVRGSRQREPARHPRHPRAQQEKDFTLESLIAAAYDSYLPEFELLVPSLLKAYDQMPAASPLKTKLAEQIDALRKWDYRWWADSVPTALAVIGVKSCGSTWPPRRAGRTCRSTNSWNGEPRRNSGSRRSRRRRTSWRPTSATGRRRGATSTGSSA